MISPNSSAPPDLQSLLGWLAQIETPPPVDLPEQLRRWLALADTLPLASAQRRRLLDLFYLRTRDAVDALRDRLPGSRPPLGRELRQTLRAAQDLLERLAGQFAAQPAGSDQDAPHRACRCLTWHLELGYLASAPPQPGIWQSLHGLHAAASRNGLLQHRPADEPDSLHALYVSSLLTAAAQPASFDAADLAFALVYIPRLAEGVKIGTAPTAGKQAAFWIDPSSDVPAHAQSRRPAPPQPLLHFHCDELAVVVRHDAAHWPDADERRVLRRLAGLWGAPPARKFPRRRRTYRIRLFSGLAHLWDLFGARHLGGASSEWMVTNESPTGCALMHVRGEIGNLGIGDIVAAQIESDGPAHTEPPYIAIVRWVLSENPEHFEMGLQLLATRVQAVKLATSLADAPNEALFLPRTPPLRETDALIVPASAAPAVGERLRLPPLGDYRAGETLERNADIALLSVSPVATG